MKNVITFVFGGGGQENEKPNKRIEEKKNREQKTGQRAKPEPQKNKRSGGEELDLADG